MTEFTASNGVRVVPTNNGATLYSPGDSWPMPEPHQMFANADVVIGLREFFQHERDEELGRWRWPEKPEFVVYGEYRRGEEQRFVRVIHEHDGAAVVVYEQGSDIRPNHPAAQAYFEAHPDRKSWHDAKPGELWVLTLDGGETRAAAVRRRLDDGVAHWIGEGISTYDLTDHHVVSGRRIWPEDAS
ncbi:hypothetical protein ACIP5T_03235 [Microbacterium sp. NPDC088619]|uniref:hypothetical protein n=1 Tax=Microbacterium sp. NPDC088619 TaxID=3364196 RepID=UPI0037F6B960